MPAYQMSLYQEVWMNSGIVDNQLNLALDVLKVSEKEPWI